MRSVRAKGKIRGRLSLALARQQSADDELSCREYIVAFLLGSYTSGVRPFALCGSCSRFPYVRYGAVATCHAVRVLTALCALVGRARAFIWDLESGRSPVRRFSEMCMELVL